MLIAFLVIMWYYKIYNLGIVIVREYFMRNLEYHKLYEHLITDKAKAIIVEYSCCKQTFTYRPFSHQPTDTSLDDLYDLVIDNTVFYAFSEDEILSLHTDIGILNDLRSAAKYAFADRLPKRTNADSDGTIGEILLDLFIQAYEPNSQKLIARAKHTEMGKKSEITGYDALYFTKSNGIITLWLGQAKAGKQDYCKRDIKKDLNTKYSPKYFSDTAFYIASRTDSQELSIIIKDINRMCFEAQQEGYSQDKKISELFNILNKYNVQIKIPCLLAYTNDIYSDPKLLQAEIEECTKEMCSYFDSDIYSVGLPLNYEIVFYIFPIKDVSYIRKRIVTLKQEVV